MSILYNCHTDGDQWRITKFNELGDVESSYLCTETECECPAGQRQTCRHRQMLPKFINREAVNTFWFYDHDRGGWVMNEPATNGHDVEPAGLPSPIEPEGPSEHPAVMALAQPFKRRV